VVPLVQFTSDPVKMGRFANPLWLKITGWTIAAAIIALNLTLLSYVVGI
jgi:manganese transport protein